MPINIVKLLFWSPCLEHFSKFPILTRKDRRKRSLYLSQNKTGIWPLIKKKIQKNIHKLLTSFLFARNFLI
jgi:hypothetical protein